MKKMLDDVINVAKVLLGVVLYCLLWLFNAFLYALPVLIVLKILGVI